MTVSETYKLEQEIKNLKEIVKNVRKYFDHSEYNCKCDYCCDEELKEILKT